MKEQEAGSEFDMKLLKGGMKTFIQKQQQQNVGFNKTTEVTERSNSSEEEKEERKDGRKYLQVTEEYLEDNDSDMNFKKAAKNVAMRMKTNVDKISAPNSQFFQSDSQHTSKHSKHKKRNGLISINTKGDDTVVSSSVSAGGASDTTSEQNTDYMQKNQSGAKGSQDSNTHYDPKKISH